MSVTTDLLERGADHLRRHGIEGARLEARLLLGHALGLSQEDLIAGQGTPNPQAMMRFEGLLRRRSAREPLAYIIGWREFWSLPFEVGSGVLIPRPDSETLIEEALRETPKSDAVIDVLDLGTGSGCLLLAYLYERPQAIGIGIDISTEALAYAVSNAEMLGLLGRASFRHGSWSSGIRGLYDVIFSNPPYVTEAEIASLAPEVAQYEPREALHGGEDGLDSYRSLARLIPKLLRSTGRAFIEIGRGQEPGVTAIFSASGLVIHSAVNDLAGVTRCLILGPGTSG